MKKLFLSLVAVIVAATTMDAQDVYVATLNHEGTISDYYGTLALHNAYKDAVAGDVITLSEGVFTSPDTNFDFYKAITIRGAGMTDGITSINSITALSGTGIKIEGVVFSQKIRYLSLDNAQFEKCKITTLEPWDGASSSTNKIINNIFTNCIIVSTKWNRNCSNNVFNNCYLYSTGTSSSWNLKTATLFNSLVRASSNLQNCNLTNCVLVSSSKIDESNSLMNCVGISTNQNVSNILSDLPARENCLAASSSMFISWDDAISTTNITAASFELSEEGKAYLGVDGTEVGMLGGNYPYNPIVSIPRITKCEVANKATADGKLSVNIEVTAPTE